MSLLIKAINEAFPSEDGGFTSAVFFHHTKDGELKTMSPLIGDGTKTGEQLGIRMLVNRMLTYSDACHKMASDINRENITTIMIVKELLQKHVSNEMLERLCELHARLKHEGLDTNEFREYGETTRRFTNKILGVLDLRIEQDGKEETKQA